MRRRLTCALGALALGWMSGSAWAQLPEPPLNSQTVSIAQVAREAPRAAHPVSSAPVALSHGGCVGDDCDHGRGGFVGGVGLYWIQPYFENNPAFNVTTTTITAAGATTTTTRFQDFRYGSDLAPQAWVGFVGDGGLGARLRWFLYDETSDSETAAGTAFVVGTPFTTVTTALPLNLGLTSGGFFGVTGPIVASSELRLDVWDFEVTQDLDLGPRWDLLVGGGVRYAHISQNYRADLAGSFPGLPAGTATVASGHNFNGAGPSFVIEGRRNLGDGGLALYVNTRGAILFGSGQQRAFSRSTGGLALFVGSADAEAHQSDVIPYGEIEVGVEVGRDMGNTRLVVQAGAAGMIWYGVGNAANNNRALSPDDSSNLGFFGLALRAGLTF